MVLHPSAAVHAAGSAGGTSYAPVPVHAPQVACSTLKPALVHAQIAFGFVDIEIIIPRFSVSREDSAL